MKVYIISVIVLFVVNIAFKGLMQTTITRIGLQIQAVEDTHSAYQVQYSTYILEKQELLRRDRIVNYAVANLGMELLKPDQLASGNIVKEILETKSKRKSVNYAFIDDFQLHITVLDNLNN